MAKHGGYAGGMMPGNMNNLMKQAQKMQRQMEETTKNLEAMSFEASAGGGVVKAVVTGKKRISSVTISPEVVDPEDIETLEDLVVAAVNEALDKMEETQTAELNKATGGLGGLGGGFPF